MIPRQVKDWMVPNPITIGPQATGAEAEALMEAHRIRHLPVVAKNLLVGMITDRDIRLASMPRPRKEPKRSDALLQLIRVEQLMTRDLVTVTPVTPIGEAARLMLEQRLGAMPVLESERLVGIISQGDLLKALLALLKSKESQGRGLLGKRRRPL
jgi:CBS domain-containing protein